MARSVTRQRVDDIDGSPAEHTVAFALDGQRFQIDLNDAHAARLRALFAPYVLAGRTASPRRSATAKSGAAAATRDVQHARHRGGRSSTPGSTPVDRHPAERHSPLRADASSPGPRSRRTLPATHAPEEPLAAVVQLNRLPRVPMGSLDVARHRRRLVAEMGELTRVVAVAMLAATADRLIGAIVKPAVTRANRKNAGRRIRGDTPGNNVSTAPEVPNSSSAAPAG